MSALPRSDGSQGSLIDPCRSRFRPCSRGCVVCGGRPSSVWQRSSSVPRLYAFIMRQPQTRMAALRPPVVCSRQDATAPLIAEICRLTRRNKCLAGGVGMADLIFLAIGGGAFVAFAGLAAVLKRV